MVPVSKVFNSSWNLFLTFRKAETYGTLTAAKLAAVHFYKLMSIRFIGLPKGN